MAQSRLAMLRTLFDQHHVDAMLVVNPYNRRYLSGFVGSAGILLIDAQRSVLITDGRYTVQATHEAPDFTIITRSLDETLIAAVAKQVGNLKRIGYEPSVITVSEFNSLRDALPDVEWVDMSGVIGDLRAIKTAQEADLLRHAIAITDQAFARVRPMLRPTMREKEAAWELHKAMMELGADDPAFEIIVGAGKNSALPHYHAGDALLGYGQPIVIDVGAAYGGYHADMTRTVILGESNTKFEQIHAIVYDALMAATNGINAGTTGKQADALARDVITAAGYGDDFKHGTGHGVGLFIHEEPRLSKVNDHVLPADSIFTIEPGIYLDDWGGVRLENIVYFDGHKAHTLTTTPFEPLIRLEAEG